MPADWLEAMDEWKYPAKVELERMLAEGKVKWSVTMIGSVQTVVKLSHYNTRLFLHLPDKKGDPRSWIIVMEPLDIPVVVD